MEDKTILIVDDTISNLNILAELLDDYDVIEATNAEDAFEIIEEEEKIDLILLDIVMPDIDGFDMCKRIKSNVNTEHIPIIFITAKTDENSIETAYDIGGSDYVAKPFKPKELLARVKKELKIQELMQELKLLASTDPMTKLYNRRYFIEMSEYILKSAKREKNETSLIVIDIDKFKPINDTYGHKVGDDVIIYLANKLLEGQRKSDIPCRIGGDEFVILLPNTELSGAIQVAKKLQQDIDTAFIELEDKTLLKFTISIGVSQIDKTDENALDEGLKKADDALYLSKKEGRNKISF